VIERGALQSKKCMPQRVDHAERRSALPRRDAKRDEKVKEKE
jgi:hypothetical protein